MKKLAAIQSLLLNEQKNRKSPALFKKALPLFLVLCFVSIAGFSMANSLISLRPAKDTSILRENKEQRKEMRKARNIDTVPIQVKKLFAQDYPNAINVNWKIVEGLNEAHFVVDGKNEIAFYNHNNSLIGTETILNSTDLPVKGLEKIQKDYPNYNIEKVVYYNDNENNDEALSLEGYAIDVDDYYAVLKNSSEKKTIILQVNGDGEIYFIDRIWNK